MKSTFCIITDPQMHLRIDYLQGFSAMSYYCVSPSVIVVR